MLIKYVKTKLSYIFYTKKLTYLILNYLKVETDPTRHIATTTNILNKLTRTLETFTIYSVVI